MATSNHQKERVHIPVMPEEVISYLAPSNGGFIIDCTTGEGGHSALIAGRISPNGRLLCCDIDAEFIEIARKNLAKVEADVVFIQSDYKRIPEIVKNRFGERPDGILVDLGACSRHFDSAERGFSFNLDGPLDMRFDRTKGQTAAELINSLDRRDLERIFRVYGEERKSGIISQAIVNERAKSPILRTARLAEIVRAAVGWRKSNIDAATKVFQALRIEVNHELDGLREFILEAAELLKPGGKMVVISFHSLEDRIVKETFRYLAADCICPTEIPVCVCDKRAEIAILTKKPNIPSQKEIDSNPRSRSAKLRAFEKLD